jgi:poly(3-hydroxybutyrate) depolymerase
MAFLWPALAALSAGGMATAFAEQWMRFAGAVAPAAEPVAPAWTTENRVLLELPTMRLRDFSARAAGYPCVICAPFALHESTVADFAPGHSLIGALRAAGVSRLFLTEWRSATPEMQFFSIDAYLADLNVAMDELGARPDLIGLCQGGWMALTYAARFPAKVRKLVLAGAPVDLGAGESSLSRLAAATPLAMFGDLVRLGGGRVLGAQVLDLWGGRPLTSHAIRETLQVPHHLARSRYADLEARFRHWHGRTVDLPGQYYLEVVDWLFKQNRLAEGRFVALGRHVDLRALCAPIFLLAAREDELVAPAQVLAAAERVGTRDGDIRASMAPGRHLGLFMGAETLKGFWPEIAQWLGDEPHSARLQVLPAASSRKPPVGLERGAEH